MGRKGREAIKDLCSGEGTQMRRGITWTEILPGEGAVWATYWAPWPWNLTPGGWVPSGLKISRTNRRAAWNLGRGSRLKQQGTLAVCRNCPSLSWVPLQPHLLRDAAPHQGEGCCGRGECSVLRDGAGNIWTWNSLWKGAGKHLLVLMETAHQKWSKTLTRAGTAIAHTQTTSVTQSSPILLRSRARVIGGGEHTLMGNRASSEPTLGLLLQPLGTQPPSQWGGISHWAKQKAQLTPTSPSSPSTSNPTCYQRDTCQNTVGKGVTYAHVRSSSPTKATGPMQTVESLPHKDIHGVGNCFT